MSKPDNSNRLRCECGSVAHHNLYSGGQFQRVVCVMCGIKAPITCMIRPIEGTPQCGGLGVNQHNPSEDDK